MEEIIWKRTAGGNAEQQELLEPGEYAAELTAIETVPKRDRKITGKEGEDLQEWRWTFYLTEPDLADFNFKKYTTRSLHEKSTAYAIITGMGNPEPPIDEDYAITRNIGTKCRIVLKTWEQVDEKTKQVKTGNYIDSWLPPKKGRTSAIKPPSDDPIPTEEELEARYKKAWGALGKAEREAVLKQVGSHKAFPTMPRAAMLRIVTEMEAAVAASDPDFDGDF